MSDAPTAPDTVRNFALFARQGPAKSRTSALEPTLGRINDRFSRFLRAALLQHLRRGVEVVAGPIELVKHRDLLERLPTPTHITLVNMKPLHGTILFLFDVQLVVAIVESRFGGSGRFPVRTENRDFTPFEQKSMRRVIDATLEQFALAWEPFGTFEPEIVRHETNPQFAAFATADDTIMVSSFEVQIDFGRGRLLTCIPYASVEPIHDALSSGMVEDSSERDLRWSESLQGGIEEASITLNVELGTIEISLAELAALRPGNVFEMERPETLTVEAGGVPLFRGRWGRCGRKIGVRIEERLVRRAPPDGARNEGAHER